MRKIDETGNVYGRLTVIKEHGQSPKGVTWLCECECGVQCVAVGVDLRDGKVRSCGSCNYTENKGKVTIFALSKKVASINADGQIVTTTLATRLAGYRYGHLTVASTYKDGRLLCHCDCGNDCLVNEDDLTAGKVTSCGQVDHSAARLGLRKELIHGHRQAYGSWRAMHKRCRDNDPGSELYPYYYGRGIMVCDRWQVFDNFIEDMGDPPGAEYSLDRVDVDGDYEPSNCRWATPIEQLWNRRNSTWARDVETDEVKVLDEWAKTLNVGANDLKSLLDSGRMEVVPRPEEWSSNHPAKREPMDLATYKVYRKWTWLVARRKVEGDWLTFDNFLRDVGLPPADDNDYDLISTTGANVLTPDSAQWQALSKVYPGARFGHLTVKYKLEHTHWLCECDCGNKKDVTEHQLIHGKVHYCSKTCRLIAEDLTGQRFGRLTVLERVQTDKKDGVYWLCECECGNVKVLKGTALKCGAVRSCGCLRSEIVTKNNTTHGMTGTVEWATWTSMFQRCENPNNAYYPNYGGRGIKVCKRWHDFQNFYEDMGPRPEGKSIDRIDVNGDYEPSNCRWADDVTQANNRRNTRYVEFNGQKLSVAEWSRVTGVKPQRIITLLERGVLPENALYGREVYPGGKRPPRTRVGAYDDFKDLVIPDEEMTPKTRELLGKRFQKLVVLCGLQKYRGESQVLCKCDCGAYVATDGTQLRNGNLKSCGCLKKDTMSRVGTERGRRIREAKAKAKQEGN